MPGVYPLTKEAQDGVIPHDAIVFSNGAGVHSFYLPGSEDLYVSDLRVPDDLHIPDNLPEEIKLVFQEMKTLDVQDYESRGIWDKLNKIIRNPAYTGVSGFRASGSGIREGDIVHYMKDQYLVLKIIEYVDPEQPNLVEISMPVMVTPINTFLAAGGKAVALLTGGHVNSEYVRIPENMIYEINGKFYLQKLPYDGWGAASWVGSTVAILSGLSCALGGPGSWALALAAGSFNMPWLVTKVYDKMWIYQLSAWNPMLTRSGAEAMRIAGGLAGEVRHLPFLAALAPNRGYVMNRGRWGIGIAMGISAFIGGFMTQRTDNQEHIEFMNDSATTSVTVAKKLVTGVAGAVGDTAAAVLGVKGMGKDVKEAIASGTYTLMATVGVFLGIALYQKIN